MGARVPDPRRGGTRFGPERPKAFFRCFYPSPGPHNSNKRICRFRSFFGPERPKAFFRCFYPSPGPHNSNTRICRFRSCFGPERPKAFFSLSSHSFLNVAAIMKWDHGWVGYITPRLCGRRRRVCIRCAHLLDPKP